MAVYPEFIERSYPLAVPLFFEPDGVENGDGKLK